MIDLSAGKAIVAVPVKRRTCKGCIFENYLCPKILICWKSRKDGKNVIFKIVDHKQ